MFKNVASQKLNVFAFDSSTGAPKTGDAANITALLSKDDGTLTPVADTSATEIDATNAKGWYSFDVSQAETNADKLFFSGKSTTANVVVVGCLIYTRPVNAGVLAIDSQGRVTVAATTPIQSSLASILARLSVAPIIVHSTTFTNDRLSLYSGDDYTDGTGGAILFRLVNYTGPTFETAQLSFAKGSLEDPDLSVEGVVTPDGADRVLTFELTRAQTTALGVGDFTYQVVRIDTEDEYTTLKEGRASLRRRIPFEDSGP